ncbi:MAG TPA: ribonuclease H family protein [Steroidobacteraceae bacterium]|nr:ribonuclease H family protein [Steroidobacteraceae bacterium]
MAQKFYVVWSGRKTGVFTDWASTLQSVDKHPGSRFKAFPTRAEAEQAFREGAPKRQPSIRGAAGTTNQSSMHIAHQCDVSIYCDGACEPNPGNAGSGVVVYRGGVLSELWYGLYNPKGTNNTAELNALHQALRMAETELAADNTVEVCSDSQYSIDCVSTWARGWEKRGWKKANGEIKNLEIIQACYAIYQRIEAEIKLTHVAAHVGTEGNELADRMAMYGAQRQEAALCRYAEPIDIAALLKMRAG